MSNHLSFPLLTKQECKTFTESLNFLHVKELQAITQILAISKAKKKNELIKKIVWFIQTGTEFILPKMPVVSKAEHGKKYPLHPQTLMLNGSYKNDLKNRLLFKSLLGEHFHFTAFGIDWLEERWLEGNPPTYQEFADMWQAEYEKRKTSPAAAKKEWAYINFVQTFLLSHPNATQKTILHAWETERKKHIKQVATILTQCSLKVSFNE